MGGGGAVGFTGDAVFRRQDITLNFLPERGKGKEVEYICAVHANLSLILTHTAVALATRDAFGTQEAQTETTFLLPELVRSFFFLLLHHPKSA